MRFFNFILVLAAFVVFNSCSNDDEVTIPKEDFSGRLQFDQLEVGQKSQYVFFIGENYDDISANSYNYVTDTMVLEIFDKDEYGYLVREYLTPGSASLHEASNVAFPDAVVAYYLNNEGGELKLISKEDRFISRLFQLSSKSERTYDLDEMGTMEIKIKGWSTNQPLFSGILEGFTTNYRQLNLEFDNLNVLIDNSDIVFGGTGNTTIYSGKYGLIRATSYNASTGKGFGWDLLP